MNIIKLGRLSSIIDFATRRTAVGKVNNSQIKSILIEPILSKLTCPCINKIPIAKKWIKHAISRGIKTIKSFDGNDVSRYNTWNIDDWVNASSQISAVTIWRFLFILFSERSGDVKYIEPRLIPKLYHIGIYIYPHPLEITPSNFNPKLVKKTKAFINK